jgi:hypothetical protein
MEWGARQLKGSLARIWSNVKGKTRASYHTSYHINCQRQRIICVLPTILQLTHNSPSYMGLCMCVRSTTHLRPKLSHIVHEFEGSCDSI